MKRQPTLLEQVFAKRAETESKDVQPSDVLNPRVGIFCPFQQPDRPDIWCMVWKNWEDFQEWGEGGHNQFCRVHCQYGRNPEAAQRSREARLRAAGKEPAWQRAMPKADPMFHPAVKAAGPPKDYQKPRRGRKVG